MKANIRFNPLPSPKRGRSPLKYPLLSCNCRFQSAPLTEARGDRCWYARTIVHIKFQSAPLTEARGDGAMIYECYDLGSGVSIRSPHRSEGRSKPSRWAFDVAGFNPLPSPKRGEIHRS